MHPHVHLQDSEGYTNNKTFRSQSSGTNFLYYKVKVSSLKPMARVTGCCSPVPKSCDSGSKLFIRLFSCLLSFAFKKAISAVILGANELNLLLHNMYCREKYYLYMLTIRAYLLPDLQVLCVNIIMHSHKKIVNSAYHYIENICWNGKGLKLHFIAFFMAAQNLDNFVISDYLAWCQVLPLFLKDYNNIKLFFSWFCLLIYH